MVLRSTEMEMMDKIMSIGMETIRLVAERQIWLHLVM